VLAEILHGIKSPQGLDIHFFGADPRPDDQPFYTRWSLLRDADGTAPSFADLDAGIHWTGTVSLADARITIVAAPMPDAPVLAAYNRARLVLIAGLVLTAVTVLYVFLSQRISAEARAARRQLFFSNLLLNTAMEATPDGMLIVDDGMRILSTNGRFAELFRVPTTLLVAKQDSPVLEWVAAQAKDRAAFVARVRYLYDNPEEIAHEDLLLADGRVLDRHSAPLFATDNHYLGRIWFFRDVSEERIAEQQLSELARVDGLTGIANRRAFTERLAQAFAAARRGEMGFAVLALDLDHFKDINDNFGHPAGDAVLAELGRRLRGAVRETDMVARLGGDEFAILQSGVDGRDDAATFADKLRRVLAQPYRLEMATVHATASIGVSVYTPATTAAASLLEQADRALYRAKQEGRDRYCFEPADAVPAASACALAS
jgi:diguanylate cyclase (GGDEF)-like protein